MSEQSKARVVVLGTDHPHVFALANTAKEADRTELVGIWAADDPQRAAANEKLGVPVFETVEQALAQKPALVLIGAVPSQRVALAEQALAAGAAVLVDKPLAVTHETLARAQAAVERHGKPLSVYYPLRGHPLILAAKALVDAGRIGRLVRVFACGPHRLRASTRPAWHWTRAGNGGALIDIGSHHADLCCWFAGEAPNWICATHDNLSQPEHPEFQDFAQAQMRFPGGAFGHVEVDWLTPAAMKSFGDTRFWIQGTTGKIELRFGDEVSAHLWTDQVAAEPIPPEPEDNRSWDVRLIEALAHGEPNDVPQDDVWRASRVTLLAFDSAEGGGEPVTLP